MRYRDATRYSYHHMEVLALDIRVLGTGCPNCKRLEKVTAEAIAEMGVSTTITKVTDIRDIMTYNILSTPGLVIDGRVVSYGRIPTKAEITTWVANALSAQG
jgi:small redox-active disulfide protein 2